MSKPSRVACCVALALCVLAALWLRALFPVYDLQQVELMIARDVPIGTSQEQVTEYLEALRPKGVDSSGVGDVVQAYFPTTLYMRGWWCIEVYFTFKRGKLILYEAKSIKI